MIKSSNLSWVVVSDLKKARKFFTDLGFKELTCAEEFGWAEFIGIDGGSMIGLAQVNEKDGFKAGSNAIITMTVDNIEKTCEELKQKGVTLMGEMMEIPGHCKLQLFKDADGNCFQLYQDTSR